MGAPEAGRHHKARPPPFLDVGKLVGQDAGERLRGHSGARQNPRPLQELWRRYHDHGIALGGEPDLEQERDVEHHHALAPRRRAAQECALNPANAGMDDRFQPAQRRAVPEHPLAQHRPVHRTVPDRAGKGPGDFGNRTAAPASNPCTAASESYTATPRWRNMPAAVVLPIPMEPVSPIITMTVSPEDRRRRGCGARRRPRVRTRTTPRIRGAPDGAASRGRRRRGSPAPAQRRARGSRAACRRYR